MEPLLGVEEAARVLGISPWTVRKYIQNGKLKAIHIGRRVCIEQSTVRRFLEDARLAELTPKIGTGRLAVQSALALTA